MNAPPAALILKTRHYPVHHGVVGIIRSLGRLGIPVYTIAEDHLTPAGTSRYLTRSFVWNAGNLPKQEMLDALARIGRELNRPTILIPTDDLGAILIAEEAATLRQWFVFPDILPGVPRNLANKGMLYTLCRQMGVPCPNTLAPTSLSDANKFAKIVRFPVVVKAVAPWLDPKLRVSVVRTQRELVDVWHRAESSRTPNLLIQEYVPHGEDWFFHGYCNGASECLAGFTGIKVRSSPPYTGITTLGRSVTNDVLLHQAETLLKAISYAGIMDIDYRFDKRDGQYKLLDFNPRIGAQFRVFVDENGLDVARALYRDLTGHTVQRARQVDGRVFVVEPDDLRASVNYFRRGELSAHAWVHSFNGRKEFAWLSWDDPLPSLIAWARLAIQGAGKIIRTARSKSNAARQSAGVDQECKSDQAMPIPQYGLWSRLISIINSVSQTRARPRLRAWLGRRATLAEDEDPSKV
jgi:predicted ATP-grasp superfamily ATP-dependent carboligase